MYRATILLQGLRIGVFLSACTLSACSAVSDLHDYDAPIPQGQGVLLISVQTGLPIQTLHLINIDTGADDAAVSDIPAGYTVRAVLVKAGDYEWLRADFPDNLSMQGIENRWVMLNEHTHLRFGVKTGIVNYPGDLVIQQSAANQMSVVVPQPNERGAYQIPQLQYHFGLINREAQAKAAADGRTQAMINRVGLIYTGPANNGAAAPRVAATMSSPLPKNDCEKLMNAMLPYVEDLLKKRGEFHPYAAALDPAGQVFAVGVPGTDNPQSSDVIGDLKKTLMEGARTGRYLATAIIYDVQVTIPTSGEQTYAIAVRLDHRDNYSVKMFVPYQLAGTQLVLGTPFAEKGEGDIFPAN